MAEQRLHRCGSRLLTAGYRPEASPPQIDKCGWCHNCQTFVRKAFGGKREVLVNVLGISGLSNSADFKRCHGDPAPEELRIRQGLDAAAALVVDGEIVAAAAEERFTGEKQTGSFPARAINYCLSYSGLHIDQIDEIVQSFDFSP